MKNYEVIKKEFDELKAKYGLKNENLVADGAVHYMNGNDGTDFDWVMNDHVCEFMVFYKASEQGALKVCYNKDGTEKIYFYKDLEWEPTAEEEKTCPFDVAELAGYLYGTFDQHNIWDQPITDWDFPECNLLEDEEEDDYY